MRTALSLVALTESVPTIPAMPLQGIDASKPWEELLCLLKLILIFILILTLIFKWFAPSPYVYSNYLK